MAKVLFLAHDYPPARSPQALRALAHVQALEKAGHELLVVSRAELDTRAHGPLRESDSVSVMRVSPGWPETLIWRLQSSRKKQARCDGRAASSANHDEEPQVSLSSRGLNWKGRLVSHLRKCADVLLFPDRARVWAELAVRPVRRAMQTFAPELVFASHEPASSILLAIKVKPAGIPMVVDLGDPFVTEYTPGTWSRSRLRFERRVVGLASAIVVTSKAFAHDLRERFPETAGRVVQIPQGYGPFPDVRGVDATNRTDDVLRLIYTGRFYEFRNPVPLLEAVRETEGVVLDLLLPDQAFALPEWVHEHPRIRVKFGASHTECMAHMLRSDVVVNIANRNPLQIPGKFFEYLGSGKPILHVHLSEEDEQAAILRSLSRGWVCPSNKAHLATLLSVLAEDKRAGALGAGLDLSEEAPRAFSKDSLGERLAHVVGGLVPGHAT